MRSSTVELVLVPDTKTISVSSGILPEIWKTIQNQGEGRKINQN